MFLQCSINIVIEKIAWSYGHYLHVHISRILVEKIIFSNINQT